VRKAEFAAKAGLTPRDLTQRLAKDKSMREVADALRLGNSATIEGTWGSSKAMVLGALAAAQPALVVAVVPHPSDIGPLVEDIRTFAGTVPAVFPAHDNLESVRATQELAVQSAFGLRIAVLKSLAGPEPPSILVASIQSLVQPVPTWDRIKKNSRRLERGMATSMEELLRWLTEHGWERQDAVELPGEFSLRGGILDIFPIDAPDPLRVEWFGDEVESIREFSVESQRSLREIERIEITAMGANEAFEPQKGAKGHFVDVAPPGTWYALLEPNELREQGQQYLNRLEDARKLFSVEETWKRLVSHPTVVISNLPYSSVETTCSLHVESIERFSGDVTKVRDELDRTATSEEILIACHNEAEAKRLREILADGQAAK
jgi:transcription-repair coupling factor (superfamily II helicase)